MQFIPGEARDQWSILDAFPLRTCPAICSIDPSASPALGLGIN